MIPAGKRVCICEETCSKSTFADATGTVIQGQIISERQWKIHNPKTDPLLQKFAALRLETPPVDPQPDRVVKTTQRDQALEYHREFLRRVEEDLSPRRQTLAPISRLSFVEKPGPNSSVPSLGKAASPFGSELVLDHSNLSNQCFLLHERWILDTLHKIEQIPSYHEDLLTLKSKVSKAYEDEYGRLETLKLEEWNRQRDEVRLTEARVTAHTVACKPTSTAIFSTDNLLRSRTILTTFDPITLASHLLALTLHALCGLSVDTCSFLLLTLQLIIDLALRCNSIGIAETSRVISSIPRDINTVVDHLNLKPTTRRYVCCSKCFKLYSVQVEIPNQCTYMETPTSKPCDHPLSRVRRVKGSERQVNVREFLYRDLRDWLGRMLCRPGIENVMDRDVSTSPEGGALCDIFDGSVLKGFLGPDGKPFMSRPGSEGRFLFGLCVDGFNPFQNKQSGKKLSSTAIQMVCLNLPRELRFLEENMCLVGVIPGPNEPSKHRINNLLSPLVDDLEVFWKSGVWYTSTASHPSGRLCRAALIPLISDLKAARPLAGYAPHNSAKNPCHICDLPKSQINDTDFLSWPERSWETQRRQAKQWRDAQSEKERKTLYEQNGIRWSELMRLPYWNAKTFTLIDTMHTILLGNIETHCRNVWGMSSSLDDGDGLGLFLPLKKPNSLDPTAAEMATACNILRMKNLHHLGGLTTRLLKQLCIEKDVLPPIIRDQRKKHVLLANLRQYRIDLGWFSAEDKLIKNPHPDEISDIASDNIITIDDIQQLDSILMSEGTHSNARKVLFRKRKDLLIELFIFKAQPTHTGDIEVLRSEVEKESKKGIIDRLMDWRGEEDIPKAIATSTSQKKTKNKETAVLGKGVLNEIRIDRQRMYVPSWIQQVPPEVGSAKAGKLTADQWRTFGTVNLVVSLIRLWGNLQPSDRFRMMLENFMHLAAATKLSHMRSLRPHQIDQYTSSMRSYLEGFLSLYPHRDFVPKNHLALHLATLLRQYGPVHSWRTFPFERVILTLQNIPTNSHIGELEKTMLERFCLQQEVRSLISEQCLPSSLHPLVHSFQQQFESKLRGTFVTDMLGYSSTAAKLSAKSAQLSNDVRHALQLWFRDNEMNKSVPNYGVPLPSISHQGATYKPVAASRGDSCVVFGSSVPEQWEAAQIEHIFSVTLYHGEHKDDRIFLSIRRFEPLQSGDIPHDHYRRFPLIGGRIYYNSTLSDITIITPCDLISHFALTPNVCSHIRRDHIHVLPLDRDPVQTAFYLYRGIQESQNPPWK